MAVANSGNGSRPELGVVIPTSEVISIRESYMRAIGWFSACIVCGE